MSWTYTSSLRSTPLVIAFKVWTTWDSGNSTGTLMLLSTISQTASLYRVIAPIQYIELLSIPHPTLLISDYQLSLLFLITFCAALPVISHVLSFRSASRMTLLFLNTCANAQTYASSVACVASIFHIVPFPNTTSTSLQLGVYIVAATLIAASLIRFLTQDTITHTSRQTQI